MAEENFHTKFKLLTSIFEDVETIKPNFTTLVVLVFRYFENSAQTLAEGVRVKNYGDWPDRSFMCEASFSKL